MNTTVKEMYFDENNAKRFAELPTFLYEDAKITSTYADADADGRLFDRLEGAIKYAKLFGGKICALVDYTLNEFYENEEYTREFLVV